MELISKDAITNGSTDSLISNIILVWRVVIEITGTENGGALINDET